jgi:hypothetical protein
MTQEFLIRHFQGLVDYNQEQINKLNTKLHLNFVYNFAWVGEDLFKCNYKMDLYNVLIYEIKEYGAKDTLTTNVNRLKTITRSAHQVREESTGALHRETSTWKFMCMLELLNELESYLEKLS